jgi:hypothetical protein
VLKADSEATVETGTAKMSRVNRDIIGNFPAFNFHQERISKSASRLVGSTGSDRYSSNSVFVGSEFVIPLRYSLSPALVSLTTFDELELGLFNN